MVTVAIHQPNYLPGCTYFSKLAASDIFVLLDVVQFSKNNWTNRNRIKAASGPQWLTVPVRTAGHLSQSIEETLVDERSGWERKHQTAIRTNYGRAPHFGDLAAELMAALDQHSTRLAELNEALLRLCLRWLDVEKPVVLASRLTVGGGASELLCNICKAVGGSRYLSGAGGRKYLDADLFSRNGIEVAFHDYEHPVYRQLHGSFEANLSVIDLLFNEGDSSLEILRSGTRIGKV